MLASLALLLSFQTVPQTAGRYDFFERLKLVDVAWMATQDAKRRKAATEHLIPATASFFRLQFADAAKELDLAAAALEARKPRASDAVSIKLESPFVEPGKPARVRVSWAYSPNPKGAAVVGAGSKTVRIRPGETSTLEVNPHVLNPDLRLTPEIGYLMPVRVGPSIRHLYVSLVKNAPARADMLTRSSHPHVKSMGEMLSRVIRRPETLEVDLPLIQFLFSAESLEEGRSKLQDLEQVYYGVQGSTTLRAAFPKELVGKRDAPVDVVVALHAAGGSENMFFEAYGRGIAVSEAIKRGWVFIAPRNSRTAVQDAVDWLQDARGLKVRNLFVIGHSSGGGAALGSYETKPAPTAFGLFAPALATVPQSVFQAPIYLSIGKQDTGRLYGSASSIGREMGNRPTFRYQEFDPCEHLMLVAESIPGAYAFFEKISR